MLKRIKYFSIIFIFLIVSLIFFSPHILAQSSSETEIYHNLIEFHIFQVIQNIWELSYMRAFSLNFGLGFSIGYSFDLYWETDLNLILLTVNTNFRPFDSLVFLDFIDLKNLGFSFNAGITLDLDKDSVLIDTIVTEYSGTRIGFLFQGTIFYLFSLTYNIQLKPYLIYTYHLPLDWIWRNGSGTIIDYSKPLPYESLSGFIVGMSLGFYF